MTASASSSGSHSSTAPVTTGAGASASVSTSPGSSPAARVGTSWSPSPPAPPAPASSCGCRCTAPRRGLAGRLDGVAAALEVGDDLVGVDRVAGLQCQAYLDLLHVEVQPGAVVLDLEDVQAEPRDVGGQAGQGTGSVVEDDPEHHVTAGRRKTVVDDLDEQQWVHVAPGQDRRDRAGAWHLAGDDGRQRCRAGR